MPAVAPEYTPLRSRHGTTVHAATLHVVPLKTVCGKKCDGWIVALAKLNCPECRAGIHMKVKPGAKENR